MGPRRRRTRSSQGKLGASTKRLPEFFGMTVAEVVRLFDWAAADCFGIDPGTGGAKEPE